MGHETYQFDQPLSLRVCGYFLRSLRQSRPGGGRRKGSWQVEMARAKGKHSTAEARPAGAQRPRGNLELTIYDLGARLFICAALRYGQARDFLKLQKSPARLSGLAVDGNGLYGIV
jgi:hypothetical protein